MSNYGNKLNPYRSARKSKGVKGHRQTVVISHNPSTISAGQELRVNFPPLGNDDVIVPGTVKLAFNLTLDSTDVNRTIVNNIGRAIVKQIRILLQGNIIYQLTDADVYNCYKDMWKPDYERGNLAYQGISTENGLKLRMMSDNKDATVVSDVALQNAYDNRFYIPLDFELLEDHAPFHQSGLSDVLTYEIIFNDHASIVKATTASTYKITNLALEYEMVTQPTLAASIRSQFQGQTVVL